jgi:hypothetical protein
MSRRNFLRSFGIASSALTLSPFFLERMTAVCEAAGSLTRVYKVMNGADCFQNIAKLWELLGGSAAYIGPTDVVVIKANGQWPNQGYTHTGCIKGVIDSILAIPGFSGEVLICDNVQTYGTSGQIGFDATVANRARNWPDQNWNSLAAQYQANGKPVATKRWVNDPNWRNPPSGLPCLSAWNPANGEGWSRYFLSYNGKPTYLSYPVFSSPVTSGRMIDLKNGVWENGSYTGRRVKTICMPTLNNHGTGAAEDCGTTSAIKSFFGATEIHGGTNGTMGGGTYYNIHSGGGLANGWVIPQSVGELVGTYIKTMFSPALYITSAIWSGWYDRATTAVQTNTVLACLNPVTLDYVSSRDVISPYASWLNPDQDNHTRQQILGCMNQGIGTIDPAQFEVITYDFNHPTTTRLDIEQKIRAFKAGLATDQDVKDVIKRYMSGL